MFRQTKPTAAVALNKKSSRQVLDDSDDDSGDERKRDNGKSVAIDDEEEGASFMPDPKRKKKLVGGTKKASGPTPFKMSAEECFPQHIRETEVDKLPVSIKARLNKKLEALRSLSTPDSIASCQRQQKGAAGPPFGIVNKINEILCISKSVIPCPSSLDRDEKKLWVSRLNMASFQGEVFQSNFQTFLLWNTMIEQEIEAFYKAVVEFTNYYARKHAEKTPVLLQNNTERAVEKEMMYLQMMADHLFMTRSTSSQSLSPSSSSAPLQRSSSSQSSQSSSSHELDDTQPTSSQSDDEDVEEIVLTRTSSRPALERASSSQTLANKIGSIEISPVKDGQVGSKRKAESTTPPQPPSAKRPVPKKCVVCEKPAKQGIKDPETGAISPYCQPCLDRKYAEEDEEDQEREEQRQEEEQDPPDREPQEEEEQQQDDEQGEEETHEPQEEEEEEEAQQQDDEQEEEEAQEEPQEEEEEKADPGFMDHSDDDEGEDKGEEEEEEELPF